MSRFRSTKYGMNSITNTCIRSWNSLSCLNKFWWRFEKVGGSIRLELLIVNFPNMFWAARSSLHPIDIRWSYWWLEMRKNALKCLFEVSRESNQLLMDSKVVWWYRADKNFENLSDIWWLLSRNIPCYSRLNVAGQNFENLDFWESEWIENQAREYQSTYSHRIMLFMRPPTRPYLVISPLVAKFDKKWRGMAKFVN